MLVLVLNLMLGICAFTNKKCREGKYNFWIRKRVLWRRPAAQTNALVVSRVGASISIYRIRTHYVYTVVEGKEKKKCCAFALLRYGLLLSSRRKCYKFATFRITFNWLLGPASLLFSFQ